MPRVVEETPLTLSPDYRPSSDEAFMGPTMLEYFRKKLEHWRLELLNELECVDDDVYANVWETDLIARIDPESGRVVGWIDLTGLLAGRERLAADATLNGIAYDAKGKRLFVTGKRWPKLFEIEAVPR